MMTGIVNVFLEATLSLQIYGPVNSITKNNRDRHWLQWGAYPAPRSYHGTCSYSVSVTRSNIR